VLAARSDPIRGVRRYPRFFRGLGRRGIDQRPLPSIAMGALGSGRSTARSLGQTPPRDLLRREFRQILLQAQPTTLGKSPEAMPAWRTNLHGREGLAVIERTAVREAEVVWGRRRQPELKALPQGIIQHG
jgi:hypothetical protein